MWAATIFAALAAGVPGATARPLAAEKLPPGTLRGPAHLLEQYPTISLANSKQRAAARALLAELRAISPRWQDLSGAAEDGYATRTRPRKPGDRSVRYFHAGRPNGPPSFDMSRPKAIIYANAPGQELVLVGVMFAMPRGKHGPTPGGPITRWHTHTICAAGDQRGTKPRRDGSCPPGTKKRQGSEMLHMWLTNDLRSAFAIHAPPHELCLAGLLPPASCDHAAHH